MKAIFSLGDMVRMRKPAFEYYETDPKNVYTVTHIEYNFPDKGEVMYYIEGPDFDGAAFHWEIKRV